jgi:predicted AAA+ superfamily ATPase
MYQRNITSVLVEALADTPVVLLAGARQTGKTTLARQFAVAGKANYLSLDDAATLAAASADPPGFVAGLGERTVIDEVQRAPALLPAIKLAVDADRRPGRFLLTGSANILALPRISESLAGRMQIVPLEPLSQGELAGVRERFIDMAFERHLQHLRPGDSRTDDLATLIATGGYPEAVARPQERRRDAWFNSYLTAIVQRDIRDVANIAGLTEVPRLLSLLAARSATLLNASELSRAMAIPGTTLTRYLAVLEATYLVHRLPAWSGNLGKRLIKAPKLHLVDAGMAAHLIGMSVSALRTGSPGLGQLLESFVVGELRRQASWQDVAVKLFHYRALHSAREVDVVLEARDGRVVGIEVKAAASVTERDFAGLRDLAEVTGTRFAGGYVLYGGAASVPFGPNLHALPVSALWRA